MSTLTHYLRRLSRCGGERADSELLEQFLAEADQDAFAHLVRRHGPMVLGVCQRLLQHNEDAEDAFQATFLVLARKAGSVRPREKLGNWLYGVAYRTACKRRGARGRARQRERQVAEFPEVATEDSGRRDLQPLLDQELRHLPEKYRTVLILCDLEGRNQRCVAEMLGSPEGTISSRLCRGRQLLAKRLARRGLSLTGAALGTLMAHQSAKGSVSSPLVSGTAQGAVALLSGEDLALGELSTKAIPLAKGVIQGMKNESLQRWMHLFLLLGCVLIGGVVAVQGIASGDPVKTSTLNGVPPVTPVPKPKEGWGHVKGRFVLQGKIPKAEKLKAAQIRPDFKELNLVDESLVVGKERGIGNVVFLLIKANGKVHPRFEKKGKTGMKLERGRFTPRIVLARAGQPLVIRNPTQHVINARGHPVVNNPFNLLIPRGGHFRWSPEKPEEAPFPIVCDIYPWMRSYVWVTDHPYVVVSPPNGRFELRDLPVGTWPFRAWHERFGYLSPKGSKERVFTLTIKDRKQFDLGTIPVDIDDLKN